MPFSGRLVTIIPSEFQMLFLVPFVCVLCLSLSFWFVRNLEGIRFGCWGGFRLDVILMLVLSGGRGDLMCLDSIFVVASIFLTNKFLCFLTKKWFICIDL